MRCVLRIIALAVALAALGAWSLKGANTGWTKTSVPVKAVDDVTGLESITYEKRFVPGVDFLGVALLASGVLAGASFWRKRPSSPNHP